MNIRIGTRASRLAVWQAEHVASALRTVLPTVDIELVKMTTRGDKILDRTLSKVGGKGLFVQELEDALLEKQVDLIVHSAKDLPTERPDALRVAAFMKRADPRDVLLGLSVADLNTPGIRVGTSSLRRASQLKKQYPHIEIVSIRGNVETRIGKIQEDIVDGVVLAKAGLDRLALLQQWIDKAKYHIFSPEELLPAVAQGILAIECRCDEREVADILGQLDHAETRYIALAERSFLRAVEGSCQIPVAGFAQYVDGRLTLKACLGHPERSTLITGEADDVKTHAERLGIQVATDILGRGGRELLDTL